MSLVPHSVVEGALNTYFYPGIDSVGTGASMSALYPKDYPGTAIGSASASASAAMCATLSAWIEPLNPQVSVDCAALRERSLHPIANLYTGSQSRMRRNWAWAELPAREPVSNFLVKSDFLAVSALISATAELYSFEPKASTASNVELEAELHLSKMKHFERASSRRRALDYMYEFLEEAFAAKKLEMINEMLLKASTGLVGHSLSVGFLRATSRARDRLSFWNYYFDAVRVGLEGDPDSERLLRGLSK